MLLGNITLVLVTLYFGFVMWMISKWNQLAPPPIREDDAPQFLPLISVIVPFKNEESTLADVLKKVLAQTYSHFEIIAVNDGSTDRSFELAQKVIKAPHQLITTAHSTGKKGALNQGIALAKGEIIVTLDADTRVEADWLQDIARSFSDPKIGMVVLPVDFHQSTLRKSVFELEFLSLVGSGLACAQDKRALMANGANLAFRKQAFLDVGGYASHSLYSSGDDQFLLFDIHKSEDWNIATFFSPHLIAHTQSPKNWSAWFSQRLRWGSKATAPSTPFAAGVTWLVFLTSLGLTLSAITSIIWPALLSWTIVAFLLKAMADGAFLLLVTHKFQKLKLLIAFPLLAVIYPFLLTSTALLSMVVKPSWKGQKIRLGN